MTAWKRGQKPANWYPERGHVCLVSLDKERPAVILSNDSLNQYSLDVCVLPISKVEHKTFSLRPKLKAGLAGLQHDSWVKCDQPHTVEKELIVYPPLGKLPSPTLRTLEAAVKAALDLP